MLFEVALQTLVALTLKDVLMLKAARLLTTLWLSFYEIQMIWKLRVHAVYFKNISLFRGLSHVTS